MATQTTGGGSTTSFGNAPQAQDDIESVTEDSGLYGTGIVLFNVMSNDLGGNAKTLFSIDDGMVSSDVTPVSGGDADLLTQDKPLSDITATGLIAADGSATNYSALGAKIWITTNGEVAYDTSSSLQIQQLAAGQTVNDTFVYAIRLGNGTLSWATVTVQVTGANDGPVLRPDAVAVHSVTGELSGVTGSSTPDTASATLSFTDVDLNDTHTVSVSAATATWSGGSTLPADLQTALDNAVSTSLTDSTHSGAGSIGVDFSAADSTFDFLAAGETLAVSYDVTVTDDNDASSTRTVTFVVHGTNDGPVLRPDAVALHGVSGELSGVTGSSTADTASTTLSFTDVDLSDTHQVSVSAASATWSGGATLPADLQTALDNAVSTSLTDSTHSGAGSIGVGFSAADSAFDFLAAGETLAVSYDVTVTDDNDASSTRTITFVVHGTNDGPVLRPDAVAVHGVSGELSGVTGSSTPDTASTTLSFTDVDLSDTHQVSVSAASATWSGGATLPADLQTALDNAVSTTLTDSTHSGAGSIGVGFSAADSAFDFLAAGETLTVRYDVTVTDDNDASSTRTVTFVVHGTNDGPVLRPDAVAVHGVSGELSGVTGSSTPDTASTTLSFTDVDLSDTHQVSVSAASATWSGGPTLPADLQTALDNAVSTTLTDSTHSGAGSIGVDFSAADSVLDFLAAGETLTVRYDVTVTDDNDASSTRTVTFVVHGTNDGPVLRPDAVAVHGVSGELSGVTGSSTPDTASTTLSFTDVDLSDTHQVSVSAASATWSGGATLPADLQTALDNAVSTTLTDSTHSGAGSIGVDFSAADSAFDFLAAGETLTVRYDVTVTDDNDASSTRTVTFVVHGTNDGPVLRPDAVAVHGVSGELSGVTGSSTPDTASTTLSFTDVDLSDTHQVSVSAASATWSGGPTLPADLQTALDNAVSTTLTDSTHSGAGQIGVGFSAADSAFDFLAAGETLAVSYDVTVTDDNDASSTRTITFVVHGTNDGPVLRPDAVAVHGVSGELSGVTGSSTADTASTTLSFTDVDLSDTHQVSVSAASATWSGGPTLPADLQTALDNAVSTTLTDSTHSGAGQIGVGFSAADSAFDFLAAGETLTVRYDVTVTDDNDARSTRTVTFVVHGTNDGPVLRPDAVAVHGVSGELSGVTGSSTADTASTTLSFTDVDLSDTHQVSVSAASATWSGGPTLPADLQTALDNAVSTSLTDSTHSGAGSIGVDFSAADSTFDFLAAGETLTVGYDVTVTDDNDASSTRTVTFVVHGTNDTASITGTAAGSVQEDVDVTLPANTLDTSGVLTVHDADHDQSVFQAIDHVAGDNGYGAFTLAADGHWTYTADNTQAAIQQLGADDHITDSFTAVSSDGTASQLVTVTIDGTNDVPTIGGVSTGAVTEDVDVHTGDTLQTAGVLSISDVDQGQSSFTAQTTAAGTYGTFTLAADGHWTYAADNSQAAIQQLGANDHLTDSFTAVSSDGTASQVVTVTIDGTNDVPTLGGVSTGTVTEDTDVQTGNTLQTSGLLTISDVDQGQSNFTAQTSAAGTYGTFTLAADGHWTYAADNTQVAIQQLGADDHLTDSFTAVSSDGTASQIVTVTIDGTNDVPTFGGVSTGTVTEDTDVQTGNTLQTSGLLTISDVDQGQSNFTAQTSAAGTYGTFTLAADGHWTYAADNSQAAIQQLGANDHLTDSFTAVSSDGTASQVVTVTIDGTNDAPVVNADQGQLSFTEGQAPSTLDPFLTLSDIDSADLHSAKVWISGNFVSGEDVLAFSNQNGITGSYDAATGVLTLTGVASVAAYQAALASVTYANASQNPSGAARTVSYQVDDGATANHASNIDTSVVHVTPVDDAPVLSNVAASAAYTTQASPVTLSSGLTVADVDNQDLAGATVSIGGVQAGDLLSANTAGTSIAAHYDATTHNLTLSGSDTLAHYQQVLDSVTFSSSSNSTATRTITWSVNDGSLNSATASTTVNVTAGGDTTPPTITSITGIQGSSGDDSTLTITFSEAMDTSSFIRSDLTVTAENPGHQNNTAIAAASGTWDATGKVFTILVTKSGNGVSYDVTLAAGAFKDLAGNPTGLETKTGLKPAGVAGQPISLSLDHPTAASDITVHVADLPEGWQLNQGALQQADGSWIVQTADPSALSVVTPLGYAGAEVLHITMSWTQADGTVATQVIDNNVEAYAAGNPIFAWAGDDSLTGSSRADTFVFSQPIGSDVVHGFDAGQDTIDLVGYAGLSSFADLQAHLGSDAGGDAVLALGDGQSITLLGVSASSLSAANFLFDQTPTVTNTGALVVGDGAMLPLSGTVANSGTISVASAGGYTLLQLIQHGATLEGGGQVILSDDSGNVISGSAASVLLDNLDNTISGAGQIGAGSLTLVNEGTIDANGSNALVIDTGSNTVVNSGLIEATGSGGLTVSSALDNSGGLAANGGDLHLMGAVTGSGLATIFGSSTIEFGAASSEAVAFDAAASGTLKLDNSAAFTGVVSGFGEFDHLDLADIAAAATVGYAAKADGSGGVLTVSDGTHTANIALVGQYDPAGFHLADDHLGGSLVGYWLA